MRLVMGNRSLCKIFMFISCTVYLWIMVVILSTMNTSVSIETPSQRAGRRHPSGTNEHPSRVKNSTLHKVRFLLDSQNKTKDLAHLNHTWNDSKLRVQETPSLDNENKTTKDFHMFSSVLSPLEKRLLLDTAKNFAFICRRLNVSYFLYGGALLGSFRHHDLIPWDDDFDVLVNVSSRDELFSALRFLSPQYEIYMAGPHLKMWSRQAKRTSKYPWGWPYLDVSFYEENDTHIWDSAKEFSDYIYPKSIVFPLHKRPIGDYFFFAPRDSYLNLKLTYNSIHCSTPLYSHKYEKQFQVSKRIQCERLRNSVPFVYREVEAPGVRETLKLGNSTIHSLVIEEPAYAVTFPFILKLKPNLLY